MSTQQKPFLVKSEEGVVILLGSPAENKLVYDNSVNDETVEACQASKSYIQLCECPHCKGWQIYYLRDLISEEIGDSDSHCYGCGGEVDWKILATVQMVEADEIENGWEN